MTQPISVMMTKEVWTIDTEDTIDQVDALFTAHKLGSAPVIDKRGDVFGIVSSSDLRRFHADKKNPKAVKAWELCTYRPKQVSPDTPISEVAEMMVKHRIHHVLVTNNGTLHGIVSSMDFVRQYAIKSSQG